VLTGRKAVLMTALVIVIATVAALPYFLPLSSFIPDVERALAQRIHQPVSIRSLRLFVLPIPHLRAGSVIIGRGSLLEVDTVTIYPSAANVFSGIKVIREVELRGVRARSELLGVVRNIVEAARRNNLVDSDRSGSMRVRVDNVTLRDVTVRFPNFVLTGVNADVRLQENKPISIRANHQRDHLQLSARRQGTDAWSIEITGRDWKLPVGLPVQFDRLGGNAVMNAEGVQSQRLSGSLYGGTFSGQGSVHWKDGWSVQGALHVADVDLKPLVALVNRDVVMTGTISAAPSFVAETSEPADLLKALHLESDFLIEHGVLRKVDLVAATKNPFNRQAGKGGQTQFDELSGYVVLDQGAYAFSDLKIGSGVLKAQGDMLVHPDKKLSGVLRAELRGTGSLLSMPFDVSGTTSDPSVFPTRGVLAGALAGTVFMPGIGTAVGMKAGELTERLFGRKKLAAKRQQ
jgi:uncharacterized protein involved in outer membrane biogenesis